MASLDDVVTVQKNGVIAVNALVQSLNAFKTIYESFVGDNTYIGISSDSLIVAGTGRLVVVSVVQAASGGIIHDCASVAEASVSNAICAIPDATGIMPVNFPFLKGLVVIPAASSVVSVSYTKA